jgi:hypothetical protein
MDTPNSYRDPYWVSLADSTGDKLGLPPGLLSSIVTKGERSNHDQVSEAGAKTVFQIIPGTRDAALKKYGVDAYLSPENAAEVAGRLLKDSLDRNKGNPYAAVAEYHGGTDRGNWGPKTRAYVSRVMDVAAPAQSAAPAAPVAGQSTFQRVLSQQQQASPASNAIAAVYDAYKAGKMTPEEAADFESDVKSGVVMLPRGATLAGQPAPAGPASPPEPTLLPKAVTDAYTSGKMTPQERADLEADMRAGIVKLPPTTAAAGIPTNDPNWKPATEQGVIQQAPEPTLGQKVVGAGEAGLTAVTGVTGGTLGMAGGTVKGITQSILDGSFGTQQAAQMVENEAMKGAGAMTYVPRTATGQEYAQNVGDAMQQAIPVMPLTAEMGALGAGMKAAAPAVRAQAGAVAAPVAQAASRAGEAVQSVASKVANVATGKPAVTPTPGTMGSAGAAATDVASMRQAAAQELPVPVDLTKGQATRDFDQLRFEQEAAKNPDIGGPIRERAAEQHRAVRQSFEAWIDQTGAEAPDVRGVGIAVDKALQARAARDKAEIRVAYKEAEKSPEALNPVDPGSSVSIGSGDEAINGSVIDYLNSKPTGLKTTALTDHAKQYAIKLGVAERLADGSLAPLPTNVKTMEALRREISQATGFEPAEIRDSTILKKMIDAQTEDAAGPLYTKARSLRAKYADQYENRAVISDLINNKRGMADRKVALEDVFDRVVFRGSLDDMRYARKMLQTGGEDGKQAWKEIQGQAVRYIRDEATKNVARDTTGNEMISPAALDKAVRRLDSDGKLDYLFGKRGAEQLRAVNDLAKVMFTTPPGAVNTSNTASVLLAAMDMALSGTAGMPLPVMSGLRMMAKNIKDRKLRARVNDALNTSF